MGFVLIATGRIDIRWRQCIRIHVHSPVVFAPREHKGIPSRMAGMSMLVEVLRWQRREFERAFASTRGPFIHSCVSRCPAYIISCLSTRTSAPGGRRYELKSQRSAVPTRHSLSSRPQYQCQRLPSLYPLKPLYNKRCIALLEVDRTCP